MKPEPVAGTPCPVRRENRPALGDGVTADFDRRFRTVLWTLAVSFVLAGTASAEPGDAGDETTPPIAVAQSAPVTPHRFDGNVRDLPAPRRWRPGDPVREIPRRAYPRPSQSKYDDNASHGPDPLLGLQRTVHVSESARAFDVPDRNFNGQGFSGVNPPDTVGDVGPNHYVQMINASGGATVRIYDKALPTPNVLADFTLDSLGSGSCSGGLGDPIVLYDRFADRWMLSEFSSSGNNLCMYVSQTDDPTGSYFAYQFTAPSFPDYPKYGVWPTDENGGSGSYIVTTNEAGLGVYAMDRGAMLAGTAATFQRFSIADLPGFAFNAVTPADLDGPEVPPVGAPAVIMRQRDSEPHGGPSAPDDVLEMWHFDVDWVVPSDSTLAQQPDIVVAEFDSALCGLTAFACFPQPGTGTTLDPLREVIMNRLQYFNFSDHESLVGNFVTDVDGNDLGGLRWFELRRVGGEASPWTLHQEGTYSPDTDSRFMAASAMDQSGNIGIAYNVTSTSTFPSLRYTGRQAEDPLGTMTQPETSIVAGSGSNSSNRYGDYSGMNLDPEDDCTFWFTGEYNASSSWSTRIASFRFDACGCELFPLPLSISGGVGGSNQVDLSWNDSELPDVIEYRVMRSRTPGGPYTVIDTVADSSPGSGNGAAYNYSDATVSGGIDYHYIVTASDGGACTSDPSNELSVTATGACILAPLFNGLETAATPNSSVCTLDLTWSAATPECAGPMSYAVYRSTTPGFDPGPVNLLTTVTTTAYSDFDQLVSGQEYFYIVRAIDDSNGVADANTAEVSAVPFGNLQSPIFTDDGGDTGAAQLTTSGPWSVDASGGNNGSGGYATGDYGNNTCADLVTPSITLGFGNTLSFWSSYSIESGWDKGEVQISIDGGGSWTRLEVGYPASSTQTSDACGLPAGDYFTGSGTAWTRYTADLSPWDGQTVMIRWLISSDSGSTGSGWNIDDIEIGSDAAACATASACEDNPFVDVTPDGSLTLCVGESVSFSAGLTAGNGPFEYQWTRDGLDIGGAAGPTYDANDVGSYLYNVDVRAQTCPDAVTDPQPTRVTWRDAPTFAGVQSASNAGADDCTIQVDWNAAASFCPGAVTYTVYRDTVSPVVPSPGTELASGLLTQGLTDTQGLVNAQIYHYLVRAIEPSTGKDDGNTMEASATPSGPNVVQAVYLEDFETADLAGWTVSTGPGPHTCGEWIADNAAFTKPGTGDGYHAVANSVCGSGAMTSTILESPVIDTAIPNLESLTLNVDLKFQYYAGGGNEDGSIQVWDGATWRVVWSDSNAYVNERLSFDVTAFANADFQVRFSYQNAALDAHFSVDNVELVSDAGNLCSTVTAGGPAPAPDGSSGTIPLRGENLADGIGDTLELTWDASCAAAGYNLIYGDLSGVATYLLSGSECGIGTTGTYTWTGVPAADLYFLIVGTDGVDTESSWGVATSGERNGAAASGECGVASKDLSGTCP